MLWFANAHLALFDSWKDWDWEVTKVRRHSIGYDDD